MWIVIVAAIVAVVLAGAAWSDHRDRKQGRDPADRARGIQQRRRDARSLRRQRVTGWLARKTGASAPSEDRPWER